MMDLCSARNQIVWHLLKNRISFSPKRHWQTGDIGTQLRCHAHDFKRTQSACFRHVPIITVSSKPVSATNCELESLAVQYWQQKLQCICFRLGWNRNKLADDATMRRLTPSGSTIHGFASLATVQPLHGLFDGTTEDIESANSAKEYANYWARSWIRLGLSAMASELFTHHTG